MKVDSFLSNTVLSKLSIMPFLLFVLMGACEANDLTIWLIPSIPGGETVPGTADLEAFNRRFGQECPVTVANTNDPYLCDQLLLRNPEFSEPDWHMVFSQKELLVRLEDFAKDNQVHVSVRFLSWCRAFSYLRSAAAPVQKSRAHRDFQPPDIAQIGDTWVAYFADQEALLARPANDPDDFSWRSLPGRADISLRYITDLRLLFYWKRLPHQAPDAPFLQIDPESWEAAVESLVRFHAEHTDAFLPPVALPLAHTPNLIHDYAPLTWSGGGAFIDTKRSRMSIRSEHSLAVPLFLARNSVHCLKSGEAVKILSFPEISHEECCYHFLRARFLATIEPASFIARWTASFSELHASDNPVRKDFWDYAAVAGMPGRSWKGGSDLAIFKSTDEPRLALRLARFVAGDPVCLESLAKSGFMPSQMPDFGVRILLENLDPDDPGREELAETIRGEILSAREHAALPEWPTFIESADVLDGFQNLWRAVGRGDRDGNARIRIENATRDLELCVNRNIHWPTRFAYLAGKWSWAILSAFLFVLCAAVYHFRKIGQKDRLLRVAIELLRRRDHVLISRMGALLDDASFTEAELLEYFPDEFARVRDMNGELYRNIEQDFRMSGDRRQNLEVLVEKAWRLAVAHRGISHPRIGSPEFEFEVDRKIEEMFVERMPYALVAILQEWFYNALKTPESDDTVCRVGVSLWKSGGKTGIAVRSSKVFPRERVGPFLKKNTPMESDWSSGATGPDRAFQLIGELCRSLYREGPEFWWIGPEGELVSPSDQAAKDISGSLFIIRVPAKKSSVPGSETEGAFLKDGMTNE